MATANPAAYSRPRWQRRTLAGVALIALGALVLLGGRIGSYAVASAAIGARQACSCRYVGGRDLADCHKDFAPGMTPVVLSEDSSARSITARVPLLSRQTATFRPGEGCRLDRWR